MKIKKVYNLVGKEVRKLLVLASLTGFLLFAAEYAFIIVLQGFLIAIGIADKTKLDLPAWIPLDLKSSLLCFLLVGVLRTFALMLKSYLMGITNQKFLKNHRNRLFEYSIYHAEKTSSHEVSSLFTDVLSRAGSVILDSTALLITFTSMTLLLIAGFSFGPYEMILGIAGLFLSWLPIRFLNGHISNLGAGLNRDWERTTKFLLESIRQNFFFRAHGLEELQLESGHNSLSSYESHYKRFYLYSAFKNGFPNVAGIFLICMIAFISIHYFDTKGSALLAFLYIFIRIAQSAGELSVTFSHIRLNWHSFDKLVLWNKKIETELAGREIVRSQEKQLVEKVKSLKASDVTFCYKNTPDLFKGINFDLKLGDIMVISGRSGSGKSTFLSLLLGLHRPTAGTIFLNGIEQESINKSIKRSFAYVGPEPFLFSGSVRDNLLFGNLGKVSDEQIWKALKVSQGEGFVKSKEGALDFILDEHAEISTGQKQRLSICRAILRDAQVLILDEATANLDVKTEKIILDSMKPYFKRSITFIVTHKKLLLDYATISIDLDSHR